MQTTTPRLGHRGAAYGRMSDDDGTGQVKVDDQLDQCRVTSIDRGIDLVAELADNGISAYKDADTLDGTVRPDFRKLVHLVRSGQIDNIVVYQMSRLVRNRGQRAELITLCGQMKVNIVSAKGQDFNLASATGRGFAGMLGEQDSMESELKSERTRDAVLRRAKEGRPSSTLGYGWTKTGAGRDATWVAHEDEAAIIAEMVSRVASGDTITNIRRDLNERGVPAPKRADWIVTTIRTLVLRPSNAGLRVLKREGEDEQVFPGCWPALVPREQWEAACAVLRDPARMTNGGWKPRKGARKHLLTHGIGKCGMCGAMLRVRKSNGRGNRLSYMCMASCVARGRDEVDLLVDDTIGERLSNPDAMAWAMPNTDAARVAGEKLTALNQKMKDITDRWTDGRMDDERYDRAASRLQPQITQAREELQRHNTSVDLSVLEGVIGPDARARWAALPMAVKIHLMKALGVEVVIMPTRRGPGFDPNSVQVLFRGMTLTAA